MILTRPRGRSLPLLALGLATLTACSSATPSSPSAPAAASTPLAGVWTGTLDLVQPDGHTTPAPVTWTFTAQPQTGGHLYDAVIQLAPVPAGFASTTAHATITGLTFESDGAFPSPQRCPGATFETSGTLDDPTTPRTVTAAFYAVDCLTNYHGHLTLSRR